jgi:beta-glucanase (GH16 family)
LILILKIMQLNNLRYPFLFVLSFTLWIGIIPSFAQLEKFDELVWSDDFDKDGAPDSKFWSYDLGTGQNGWGNSELQSYTNNAENVRISGGRLIIDAIKRNGAWTSARIKTHGKLNFKYGRIEFRAKLPRGSGTWPALWLLGESITTKGWPACGEIDVMEHVGKWHGEVHSALHTPSSHGNTQNISKIFVPDVSENFHIYAAEWTPDAIKFFVNDKLFYTYAPAVKDDRTWPFEESFIIINLAMGGSFGSDPKFETGGMKNGVDPSLSSARLEVDYVRVYQQFQNLQIRGEKYISSTVPSYKYSANKLNNASYNWIVPQGAEILSGQGTSEVNVNWGNVDGELKLNLSYEGQNLEQHFPVKKILKPDGETYLINDFSNYVEEEWSYSGGNFQLIPQEKALKINYNISNPGNLPGVTYSMDRPVDLINHSHFSISLRTLNKSGTVIARVDLEDVDGRITSGNNVFMLFPVIDDNEFYNYHYDFKPRFGTSEGQVNGHKIKKVKIFLNYGIFGSPGQDSVWVNSISISSSKPVVPNRPFHFNLNKTSQGLNFKWKNNNSGVTKFKIFSSVDKVNFEPLSGDIEGSLNSFQLNFIENSIKYFAIKAYNNFGESVFSNIISTEGLITSIQTLNTQDILVFPIPAHKEINVSFSREVSVKNVKIIGTDGKSYNPLWEKNGKDYIINLYQSNITRGIYFLRMSTTDDVFMSKIFVL